ncbi:bacillithiol biosynthesis deacetylase BshB2 [Halalkalibacter sp. APA_J-10(15)]|uniref:bacillithiol biosynthesis deacetylase BshB2 n=1 Tax=unclassified Halalkalibacter TaxID=2893063 RepID=UPI001FF60A31|nr:bacillithiol biosynthesis deacetylase BshB2 [Halalkalibacter sp. APA_J-10(15)]MCK0471965.1 bacillithiol biosynthesis deacetylase BshB2 [Halalkalibacter sp. APA_J-10(15)]
METERHVLVVFPHPDDETFGAAGTIAMHAKQGTPITYACLTLGEMGRNLGNPPFATRESLPLIRKKELEQAAEVMGIDDLRMLGYRDKTIEFEPEEELQAVVLHLIAELKPSLVITFYPGHSVHPDHDATGRAVTQAVQSLPVADRPKVHCIAFSNNHLNDIGEPDIIVNIEPFAEVKRNALRAHLSQTAWMLEEMEPKWKKGDPEALAWLQTERFWTYRFAF